jgi:hypothetical protein
MVSPPLIRLDYTAHCTDDGGVMVAVYASSRFRDLGCRKKLDAKELTHSKIEAEVLYLTTLKGCLVEVFDALIKDARDGE